MNIVKSNHYRPNTSFFDDFLTRDLFDWSGWTAEGSTIPRANIVETNDEFLVELAAPGIRKEDFIVELDNDMLVIQAHIESREDSPREVNYTRKEFSYDSFKRSFYLPNTVEMDGIEGVYQDGILKLVIPKKEEARRKPVRTIPIS